MGVGRRRERRGTPLKTTFSTSNFSHSISTVDRLTVNGLDKKEGEEVELPNFVFFTINIPFATTTKEVEREEREEVMRVELKERMSFGSVGEERMRMLG
jgi:hypothetical protein